MTRVRSKKGKSKKVALIKLDIACGQNKQAGFVGIDIAATKDADIVHDLNVFPWPVKAGSVGEVYCSHYFEHVPGRTRFKFMDELWRILVPDAKATFVVPYYANMRSVQDPTHEWPPVCEASFLYFNRQWRIDNKLDHYPVTCNFNFSYGYSVNGTWATRAEDARNFAISNYWNVVADIVVTLEKIG